MATQVVNLNTQMGASGASHAAGVVPDPGTTAGTSKFLREDASFQTAVQSVGLTMPSEFVVSNSPVTGSGTIVITKATEAANEVWAGPTSGSAAQPAFRALVPADVPTLNQNTTGTASNVTGIVAIVNGGTGASSASSARTNLGAAPVASPTFTGTVTQPNATVLTAATTATSAAAGSATALPATPAIYLEISINGIIYKFPGYLV